MGKVNLSKSERSLGVISIWAIGVGLVISGESFGWNNGWAILGPLGFFIPVGIIIIMYYFLTKVLTELACIYPNTESPHNYVQLAFGNIFGDFVAMAILIEFLFASPAIANSIGQYIHFLAPNFLNAKLISLIFLVIFCLLNFLPIRFTAKFAIILSIIAIAELCIFFFSVSGHIQPNHISNFNINISFTKILSALPFAIWLFLGIEGVSLLSLKIEKENYFQKIAKGYLFGLLTLIVLAILVLYCAGSSVSWNSINWREMTEDNDHPIPLVMKLALGGDNLIVHLFVFIGLGGLCASLQGISLASINQLNHLISGKNRTNNIQKCIILMIILFIGWWSIFYEKTGILIEISVFGAVCLYFSTCLSLLKLRKKSKINPIICLESQTIDNEFISLHKDFSPIKSTSSAMIVLVISTFCLASLIFNHAQFFLIYLLLCLIYIIFKNYHKPKS